MMIYIMRRVISLYIHLGLVRVLPALQAQRAMLMRLVA